MDEKTICQNIKTIRQRNGWTLAQLAAACGLTKGYLSRVERSEKAPPYTTLNKIAHALGVEVTTLLARDLVPRPAADPRISIQKSDRGTYIRGAGQPACYDYQILAGEKAGKNMEPFIIYAPHELPKMFSHEGEEFIYVLEGALELIYGDEVYRLEAGDNAYFDSRVPHSGRSVGEGAAKLLVIIYLYKRHGR
ncbi:MAG: XRE family transcriptional regulator [Desulfosarcinaceae bacterium]|nr:XRE family transcriptional regulator [Desulfosarcinaceae bacterium]